MGGDPSSDRAPLLSVSEVAARPFRLVVRARRVTYGGERGRGQRNEKESERVRLTYHLLYFCWESVLKLEHFTPTFGLCGLVDLYDELWEVGMVTEFVYIAHEY
ncbi:hypothetical protein chiPu_0014967 [Chiloscyllium punctatum]|uniref:Uncharacterized protein n=1 Tax=Chiloscyllium punctatum TaxID=137246 RepID=A0A401T1E2_CHIPU|nr:hypothetical protein [Chiloscyllium punctatum]